MAFQPTPTWFVVHATGVVFPRPETSRNSRFRATFGYHGAYGMWTYVVGNASLLVALLNLIFAMSVLASWNLVVGFDELFFLHMVCPVGTMEQMCTCECFGHWCIHWSDGLAGYKQMHLHGSCALYIACLQYTVPPDIMWFSFAPSTSSLHLP